MPTGGVNGWKWSNYTLLKNTFDPGSYPHKNKKYNLVIRRRLGSAYSTWNDSTSGIIKGIRQLQHVLFLLGANLSNSHAFNACSIFPRELSKITPHQIEEIICISFILRSNILFTSYKGSKVD